MDGPGSGVRLNKRGTVEDHRRLDVRELHRKHGIKPGSWITVNYEWRGEQVTQEVSFDWTPCNYGGHRPWLICMNCGRRVAVLYLGGKYFACRHCYNLTYTSCQESDKRFSRFLRNNEDLGGVEERSGSFPLGVRWFLLNKLLGARPAEIAKLEGLKDSSAVRGMIIRVSDQLRSGEISLLEVDQGEVEAAKAKLDAQRKKRRERHAKNKEQINAKRREAYAFKKSTES